MINCKESTLLTIKKEHGPIGVKASFDLWMHQLFCKFCKKFAKQSSWINEMAKKLGANASFSESEKSALRTEIKTRNQL